MNALTRDLKQLVELAEKAAPAEGRFRQRLHLMPPTGWLNDPNGLCQFKGLFHAFFQYSPFNPEGGVKMWGHCTSRDMAHWEYQGTALYPDQPFDCHGVYSGCALVEDGRMYLYYTGNVKLEDQEYDYVLAGREGNTVLVESEDGFRFGRKQLLMRNEDYPDDLSCHVRDPKVWKQDGRYYMVQGVRTKEDVGEAQIFVSDDRISWSPLRRIRTEEPFGYMWECPDLFELDGQWFLCVSPQGLERAGDCFQNRYACGYFPLYGDFRGACRLGAFQELDKGFDFYAPQSFLDGARRIQFGWMGMPDAEYTNPTTAYGWQHCLTVPCVLTAKDGKLLRNPVPELDTLHGALRQVAVSAGRHEEARTFDLHYQTAGQPFSLTIHDSVRLSWKEGTLTLAVPAHGAGRSARIAHCAQPSVLRILADTSSVEVFADGGALCLSTRCYPENWGVRWNAGTGTAELWEMQQP